MKLLESRIITEGKVFPGNILKVDSFLNHQIDPQLCDCMAQELVVLFKQSKITKVLTVEASGIVLACYVAQKLGVNAVFAKKNSHKNLSQEQYTSCVMSYTIGKEYNISVSCEYISKDDNVLVIDDFLAKGQAAFGLIDIIKQAGASVVGCGFAIEKGFQDGGKKLREQGYRIESLAIIDEMKKDGTIIFRPQ